MPHLDEGVLHAMLDGEITSSDLPPIQAHLDGCPECRARLDEARQLREEADSLVGAIEVPQSPGAKVHALPRARYPIRPWLKNLAWAASVLAAVGLGYFARDRGRLPSTNELGQLRARESAAPAEKSLSDKRDGAPALEPPAAQPERAGKDAATVAQPRPLTNRLSREGTHPASPAAKLRQEEVQHRADRQVAKESVPAPAPRVQVPVARHRDSAATPAGVAVAVQEAKREGVAGARLLTETRKRSQKLDEIAVSDLSKVNDSAAASRANRAGAGQIQQIRGVALSRYAPIPADSAIRQLGGALRLLDGLVPAQYLSDGQAVRVLYRLGDTELHLDQRREAGEVVFTLSASPALEADSLEVLRRRVR